MDPNGKNQRSFICDFIDEIQDQEYWRWFQEALKERYPKKVHDVKRPGGPGNRIIALARNLTWEEVKIFMRTTEIPYF